MSIILVDIKKILIKVNIIDIIILANFNNFSQYKIILININLNNIKEIIDIY